MKVCCVFLLESPRWGDSNEFTQYTIFDTNKEIHPKLSLICSYENLSKGLKNEFETAVINEPSGFEPLKLYCISLLNKQTELPEALVSNQVCLFFLFFDFENLLMFMQTDHFLKSNSLESHF